MFNQIFAITLKEIKVLLRDREALIILFLMPLAFILVMTVALKGLFEGGSGDSPVYLLVANEDRGSLADTVLDELGAVEGLVLVDTWNGQPLTRELAEERIVAHEYSMALAFPVDFSESILEQGEGKGTGPAATVSFITDPAVTTQELAPTRGMVQGYIERAASIALAGSQLREGFSRLAASVPAEQTPFIQAIGQKFSEEQAVANHDLGITYEVVSPRKYQAVRNPTSVEHNVPGYTIYGVFFIISTIATGFFREKNEGTLRRIQAAPLSKMVYLIGKIIPYYLINLLQIAIMFAIGVLVFGLTLGNSPVGLVLISLATSAAATGLGLMVTSLGKTLEQVSGLSTLLSIILSVVGGMMVPISVMPEFLQKMALFTPHSWALRGYQDIIVRGLGVGEILPAVGTLMLFALGFWGIALWRFRYDQAG